MSHIEKVRHEYHKYLNPTETTPPLVLRISLNIHLDPIRILDEVQAQLKDKEIKKIEFISSLPTKEVWAIYLERFLKSEVNCLYFNNCNPETSHLNELGKSQFFQTKLTEIGLRIGALPDPLFKELNRLLDKKRIKCLDLVGTSFPHRYGFSSFKELTHLYLSLTDHKWLTSSFHKNFLGSLGLSKVLVLHIDGKHADCKSFCELFDRNKWVIPVRKDPLIIKVGNFPKIIIEPKFLFVDPANIPSTINKMDIKYLLNPLRNKIYTPPPPPPPPPQPPPPPRPKNEESKFQDELSVQFHLSVFCKSTEPIIKCLKKSDNPTNYLIEPMRSFHLLTTFGLDYIQEVSQLETFLMNNKYQMLVHGLNWKEPFKLGTEGETLHATFSKVFGFSYLIPKKSAKKLVNIGKN